MVDPQEEGTLNDKSLVELIGRSSQDDPQLPFCHDQELCCSLAWDVKSYWPQHDLAPLALGIASECPDEDFRRYCDEAKPIAEEIVKSLAN